MALKALLNGKKIFAEDATGTAEYTCHECAHGMYYVRSSRRADGVTVIAHFAHKPMPVGQQRTCSLQYGESPEHENGKATVLNTAPSWFEWLQGGDGDTEVKLSGNGIERRADVLFEACGRRVVFEVQFTKIPRRAIAERTRDYHALGYHVVWCFPERRNDLYQFCKRHFFCVGRMSNDGDDVEFTGKTKLFGEPPTLKQRMDYNDIPRQGGIKQVYHAPPMGLPVVHPVLSSDPVYAREIQESTKPRLPLPPEAEVRTPHLGLIRRADGVWGRCPPTQRRLLRAFVNSERDDDRDDARMLCQQWGADYNGLRNLIHTEMREYLRNRMGWTQTRRERSA